jgi:rhodanese-related sulfurtransferase
MQFVINNWYLFLALLVVLGLLVAPNLMQLVHGIQSLTPAQCVSLINRQSAVVVDISEPSAYGTGHLPNAINLPLSTITHGAPSLNKYKDRPLIVIGRNVNTASKAAAFLRKQGFKAVYLMAGGLAAWEKDNLPLER